MKPLPLVVLVLSAILAFAFQTRYTIVPTVGTQTFPGAAFVLDRWTGDVRIVATYSHQNFPRSAAVDSAKP